MKNEIKNLIHTNRELESARLKAETANQTKNRFLAMISHEIRTPLNAIIGFAHLLMHTELSAEQKEYIEIITQSGNDLLSTIIDVLDITKIEAGEIRLGKINFDLEELIANLVKIVAAKKGKKSISLTYDYSPDLPRLFKGDPIRIKQIVSNLLLNALKFTEKGTIATTVRLDTTISPAKETIYRVLISVQDTGIGIPPEQQPQIFQPFTQLDMTTSRQYGGTGLGLYISKFLVEKMGGTIRVNSKPGKGSEFIFSLPLKKATKKQSKPSSRHIHLKKSARKLRTVLVVEDNMVNLKLSTILLQKLGYKTDSALNGQEAIKKAKKNKYALIFMDIQMPVMDGIEATQKIRASITKTVPIIALTAHTLEDNFSQYRAMGIDDYIVKPIDVKKLEEKVGQWDKKQHIA